VHDYDDTHLDTIIHPTGPVASALLALAEWKGGFSGKEFLLALIVGIEVECKLGLAVWPEHYDVGWFVLLPLSVPFPFPFPSHLFPSRS
jgi:aconitate decarboxylase